MFVVLFTVKSLKLAYAIGAHGEKFSFSSRFWLVSPWLNALFFIRHLLFGVWREQTTFDSPAIVIRPNNASLESFIFFRMLPISKQTYTHTREKEIFFLFLFFSCLRLRFIVFDGNFQNENLLILSQCFKQICSNVACTISNAYAVRRTFRPFLCLLESENTILNILNLIL